jgi:hypothetical protein
LVSGLSGHVKTNPRRRWVFAHRLTTLDNGRPGGLSRDDVSSQNKSCDHGQEKQNPVKVQTEKQRDSMCACLKYVHGFALSLAVVSLG